MTQVAHGRYGEAEPLYKRSLAIREKALGPDHPDVATSLNNLARLYSAQGHHDLTLEHVRRASAIHRGRAARTGGGRSAGGLSEQRTVQYNRSSLRYKRHAFTSPADKNDGGP
ncbi:MAG: tetratricopeptide repeat protein [Acidiferrobacterales bacterium]